MYKYTYRQTEIKTYRHTQTNRQTEDSAKVLVQAEKQADVQKDQYSHLLYIHTVLYIRQTCRQTDRQTGQTGQTEKNDTQTNKPTNRQYMSVE
jgi:hypothetical protein